MVDGVRGRYFHLCANVCLLINITSLPHSHARICMKGSKKCHLYVVLVAGTPCKSFIAISSTRCFGAESYASVVHHLWSRDHISSIIVPIWAGAWKEELRHQNRISYPFKNGSRKRNSMEQLSLLINAAHGHGILSIHAFWPSCPLRRIPLGVDCAYVGLSARLWPR